MKTLYCIHTIAFLLWSHCCVLAQVAIHYSEPLTVEEGLTNNKINDVLQDSLGFLWIATSYGLNRYDGEKVVQFVHSDYLPSIPDDRVSSLLQADKDRLYVGTGHGIGVLHLHNNLFTTVHLSGGSVRNEYDDQVEILRKDPMGNIWATTPSMIYRLDKDLNILKKYRTQKNPMKNRKRNVYNMICLPSGEALFWLYNGIFYWSPANQKLQLLSKAGKPELQFIDGSSYFSIALVASRYLVGKSYGNRIFILDTKTGKLRSLTVDQVEYPELLTINGVFGDTLSFSTARDGFALFRIINTENEHSLIPVSKPLLTGTTIRKVFTDNEGDYWAMPASGGLLKMAPQKQVFKRRSLSGIKSPDLKEFEISVFYPVGNKIFIGSYGGGFYTYDPASDEIQQHSARAEPYSENMVWNFWRYQQDTLWLGTQQGLIWCCLENFNIGRIKLPHPGVLDSFAITTLYEDSKGLVWMGVGWGNGVAVFDTHSRLFKWYRNEPGGYPYRYPEGAAEDRHGDMWFISDPTGNLVKWDRSKDQFEKIIVPGIDGELDRESHSLYIDNVADDIWYGLISGRLVQYNIATGKSTVYGISEGYTSGAVMGIARDKYGRLWLGNTQGISSFDPAKKQFRNYFKRDGLPASYFSSSLYFDALSDKLYAGAPGLFTWFDVKDIASPANPLKILLTDVLVNNKTVKDPDGPWILNPDQNNIHINFTGINLVNGEENRYEYKLGNAPWVSLGKQNEINFASLNPGKYQVAIRGARKNEPFAGPATKLAFTIQPHFTQTIWFFLLCLLLVGALSYVWYRYRIGYLRKVEKMRARISRDLHDEIGSRVTNIGMMSTIAGRIPHTNGNDWLQKIQAESQAVSQNLREIVWDINPENDALETALPRILRYASGFLESAGITVKADLPDLNGFKLNMEKRRDLFLIIREAVNNIVRHSGASNARILVHTAHKKLLLEVMDDGKGFDDASLSSVSGLKNMKERAMKNRWNYQLSSSPGDGTRLAVSIKVRG